MENNNEKHTSAEHHKCTGANCDYAIDPMTGDGLCFSGSGTCLACNLLEAEASPLHDETLIEATQKIKEILAGITSAAAAGGDGTREGRKLSFLVTEMGLLLAWVEHDAVDIPENAVTAKDDNATLAKALKLKNWQAEGAR